MRSTAPAAPHSSSTGLGLRTVHARTARQSAAESIVRYAGTTKSYTRFRLVCPVRGRCHSAAQEPLSRATSGAQARSRLHAAWSWRLEPRGVPYRVTLPFTSTRRDYDLHVSRVETGPASTATACACSASGTRANARARARTPPGEEPPWSARNYGASGVGPAPFLH